MTNDQRPITNDQFPLIHDGRVDFPRYVLQFPIGPSALISRMSTFRPPTL